MQGPQAHAIRARRFRREAAVGGQGWLGARALYLARSTTIRAPWASELSVKYSSSRARPRGQMASTHLRSTTPSAALCALAMRRPCHRPRTSLSSPLPGQTCSHPRPTAHGASLPLPFLYSPGLQPAGHCAGRGAPPARAAHAGEAGRGGGQRRGQGGGARPGYGARRQAPWFAPQAPPPRQTTATMPFDFGSRNRCRLAMLGLRLAGGGRYAHPARSTCTRGTDNPARTPSAPRHC